MKYNFDEIINRKHTKSIKYDFFSMTGKVGYNTIPLWIADMDFRTPPCVREAIIQRAEHGIFGYSATDDDYFIAVQQWFLKRHNWNVQPEWMIQTRGILNAVSVIVSALTKPGDAILLQYPSYHQFNSIIENTRRKIVKNPLILENGTYKIDFEDFERQIVQNDVKLFILCNPHNPVGRVFTKEELIQMGDICLRYGVLVLSDEIHQDFIFAPHKHFVFVDAKPEFRDITITCTAPTKTFNLSGVAISNMFIIDEDLRDDIKDEIKRRGGAGIGILEILACQAAYTDGEEWLEELLSYLLESIAYARKFFREKLPEIDVIEPEGTYLLWIDCRRLGFWAKDLDSFLADEAQVTLSGSPGAEGFLRINLACPRSTLEKAFSQLERAVKKL
ncbi:MalY/PatB family protein [[Clostridium] fimetarium]|uniref:cysteine-S-conjugate beta-lyase n=1 Tax=[Clostridium] fimetarium TaxID=99656 RepID=A0A1I0PNA7_9FIRM|nr:MalY/PatB family protein [[Clostridium] fimetarium]SEW15725.1 cystathione beta-lyase [[Clostridium] fimetarium]